MKLVDNSAPVTALIPMIEGEGVFVGGANGTVRAWSVSRDHIGPPLLDLQKPISSLEPSQNGRYLGVGDEAGAVSVVDLRNGNISRASVGGRVEAVAVTNDGRWVAAASDTPGLAAPTRLTLHYLPIGGGEERMPADGPVRALAFQDGGRTLLVGAYNGSVQLRSVPTLAPWRGDAPRTPPSFDAGAYSPNHRYFGFYKLGVMVWDIAAELRKPTGGATTGPPPQTFSSP